MNRDIQVDMFDFLKKEAIKLLGKDITNITNNLRAYTFLHNSFSSKIIKNDNYYYEGIARIELFTHPITGVQVCYSYINAFNTYINASFCKKKDAKQVYRHMVKFEKDNSKIPVFLNDSVKKKIDDFINTYLAVKNGKFKLGMNRGLLLSGEPGNGKTYVAGYIFDKCKIGNWKERNEATILNEDICNTLIDDISPDVLSRNSNISSTLLSMLDNNGSKNNYLRIFTTNETIINIDPAFLRPGRIDTVIAVEPPNRKTRIAIFDDFSESVKIDVEKIADLTDGCSYAKLNMYKTYIISESLTGHIDLDKIHEKVQTSIEIEKDEQKMGFR